MRYYLFISLTISLTLYQCKPTSEVDQAAVLAHYEVKVAELKAKKLLECKAEAIRLAETIADSTVRALQIDPLSDPLYNPNIPDRPKYIPVDTSVFDSKHSVKPIL